MDEIHLKRVIASGTVITRFGLSFIFLFIHNIVPFKNSSANKRDKHFINSFTHSTSSFKQRRPSLSLLLFYLQEPGVKLIVKLRRK